MNLAQFLFLTSNVQRPSGNNISLGQNASKQVASTSVTTTAVTTQASGSTFIVCAASFAAATSYTISDSKGNTYTLVGTISTNTADNISMGVYLCVNGTGGSAHTFTAASAQPFTSIYALELIGVATVSPLDGNAIATSNTLSTGPYVSGNITTTNANDILVAFCAMDAETYPQSGTANTLTLLSSLAVTANGLGISCATQLETSTLTQQGSFSGAANGTYGITSILALKSS